jgi:ABC-2 type transport system ATP-binding protein
MNEIICTKSLSKSYSEIKAVDRLDLSILEGEIFGFLGHNGAGKTTTISMLTTLLLPTSGSGLVAGFDIVKEPLEVRRQLGYLPENVQLYESMTGYENLKFFASLSEVAEPNLAIEKVVNFLDISSYIKKRVGQLSKGMRQRIGIAQAIIHEPKVLFLDEPSSGLDPMGMKQLRDILLKLNQERGMTIFMNTHLLSEVTAICDSIAVLNAGKLIYQNSLEETMKRFKDSSSLEQIYFSIETDHSEATHAVTR